MTNVSPSYNPQTILAKIAEEISRLMNQSKETLNIESSFLEMGIDSIRSVDLVEALNLDLGIQLGPEVIFDYRGPVELMQHIMAVYGHSTSLPINEKKNSLPDNQLSLSTQSEIPIKNNKSVTLNKDIAIIGISGKFAGSENLNEYWQHLEKGDCCIKEIHRNGWDESLYYDLDSKKSNKSISKWGGFLKTIDEFDPLYFNISPREAERMDPQQRLFLEESIKAFEDSGYSGKTLSDQKIGVFVGCRGMDYKEQILTKRDIDSQIFLGNDLAILSGRISYHLNLKGPNLTIDAACSSSLVALHLACESIKHGESEMALAGGVFLLPSPQFLIMASKGEMLSPKGKCLTLNENADGMVVGEGVGALVLKPLDKAIEDNDHIYGLIKGFGVNHNGKTQGITAPSSLPQQDLIFEVLNKAGINPETITYNELQGTGTMLGDPIEIKALTGAFRSFTDKKQFCAIGSHTPNIGHAMNAAGMAAIFKVLLAMKHQTIPAFIGLEKINKNIHLHDTPFYPNLKTQTWKVTENQPRRAGLGTFAFNGTNCYFLLEEYPKSKTNTQLKTTNLTKTNYLVPISAKTDISLKQRLRDMYTWLEDEIKSPTPPKIENIVYTLQVGRDHHTIRCAIITKSLRDLLEKMKVISEKGTTLDSKTNFNSNSTQGNALITTSQKPLYKEIADKLIGDIQGTEFISEDQYKEKLEALADLYISGYDPDWNKLYQQEPNYYSRIPLPAYPFSRTRYWISGEIPNHSQHQKRDLNEDEIHLPLLEDAIDKKSQPLMDSLITTKVERGLSEVQTVANRLILKVFQQMGIMQQGGIKYNQQQILNNLKILPRYFRLFEALLKILNRAGFIQITEAVENNVVQFITSSSVENPKLKKELTEENIKKKINQLLQEYPEIKPYTRLLWTTHQKYPHMLKGQIPATDVMFPHSSMELMEGIYRGNKTADYYNHLTAWTVVSYIKSRLSNFTRRGKIKILEIGAGTGGTSAIVFNAVRSYAESIEYFYTDISAGFTRYGKKQYESQNPFVIFKVLDIEKDIIPQGYEPGTIDVIIATNVLHATRNISQTLSQSKLLLKSNGWVIANELTGVLDIYTINFGLLEGWWLYEDKINRIQDSPLLTPESWEDLLRKQGFDQVQLLGNLYPHNNNISQHVIVGEKSRISQTDNKTNSEASEKLINKPNPVYIKSPSSINSNKENQENLSGVEDQILEILADILQLEKRQLNPETPHTDYGVDSILAIEIIDTINLKLGTHLKSTDLFNYPTVKKLSDHIVENEEEKRTPQKKSNDKEIQIATNILEIISKLLQIDQTHLNKETLFTDFGMDTFTANRLIEMLNEELGTALSSLDLINYSNIARLTTYILETWGEDSQIAINELKEEQQIEINQSLNSKESSFNANSEFAIPVESQSSEQLKPMAIAVIGMAIRCPDTKNIIQFWQNLSKGVDSIREVTRWSLDSFYSPELQKPGKSNCKYGGFLQDIDTFDPLFFNISPKEAELMDPQHRLFLEESWKALEDAGYADKSLEESKCGVFVGFNMTDYQKLLEKNGLFAEAYTFTGNHEAILSARLSYFLNLRGPGITINTACSTSLVAVHLACESIRCGTSDMAIAGGAQLMITPDLYIKTSRAGMLSAEGRCKTFDNSADGFVPGEGVGVVVLKSLQTALLDGDHIYGVIVGSGINQDGKSNGITAPNAPSQTQLETQVYERYCINPETITYIEAHGTGTRLGDPIEIDALTAAFNRYTQKKQYCAIGSVKTNIGHTGAAAGVTGLIKTLLCLKYKKLVPSLNFKKENEFINFKDSPFYVNTQLKDWQPLNGNPRIAAVSSFGFSGTNAHLIVKEIESVEELKTSIAGKQTNIPSSEEIKNINPWYIIPISAKTPSTLEQQLEQMESWFEKEGDDYKIQDISYTLLVGRSHFTHCSVILAKSNEKPSKIAEKIRTIRKDTDNKSKKEAFRENYLSGLQEDPQFKPSPALHQFGEHLLQELQQYSSDIQSNEEYRKKLLALADLYTKGYNLNWENLYISGNPKRISLPTYPFETGHYWFSEKHKTDTPQSIGTGSNSHHFLIDRLNLEQSINQGVVFQKTLAVTDNIVQDHMVQGRYILPGVGHLEMALAAVMCLKNIPISSFKNISITNATWLLPLEVPNREKNKDIFISIKQGEGKENGYIYEIRNYDNTQAHSYSYGEITILNNVKETQPVIQQLSIEAIKARCTNYLESDAFYSIYSDIEITYGPYFKGVAQAWGNEDEAIGELILPSQFEREHTQYILHPCLTDGALQIIMAVTGQHNSMRRQTTVPFSVEEVEIINPHAIQTHGYSYVKSAGPNRYHIAILDEHGNVCVKFHEVAVRELRESSIKVDTNQLSYYTPQWNPQPLQFTDDKKYSPILILSPPYWSTKNKRNNSTGEQFIAGIRNIYDKNVVFPVELETGKVPKIEEFLQDIPSHETPLIYFLGGIPIDDDPEQKLDIELMEQAQEMGVLSLFRLIKELSRIGYTGRSITLKVVTSDVQRVNRGNSDLINPFSAGLHGMVRSMQKEYPLWKICCIDISLKEIKNKAELPESLLRKIQQESGSETGSEIVFRNENRYVQSLIPVTYPPESQNSVTSEIPFKTHGVYCILGGTGGIGLELGLYLAEKKQARLVLMDKCTEDQLTQEKKKKLAQIKTLGGQYLLLTVNVEDPESMTAAIKVVNTRYGKINGVFHSAIILKDKLLENMDEELFCQVLAPKVRGSIIMYNVFREQNPDFIMFFSSAQSFLGNPGQANYAAACTFKDAYAHYLSQITPSIIRTVNWGYWGSVGIVSSTNYNQMLANQGMQSIKPSEGMNAITKILSNSFNQVLAIKGEISLLEKMGVDLNSTWKQITPPLPHMIDSLVTTIKANQNTNKESQNPDFQKVYGKTINFGRKLLLNAFREMGVFRRSGERYKNTQLEQQLNILPIYSRLFNALLAILKEAGYISLQKDELITSKALDEKQLKQEIEKLSQEKLHLINDTPDIKPHIELLWTCLSNYPQILSGNKTHMEVMFPGGTRTLVEGIYKENPSIDYYNRIVTTVVKEYISQRLNKNPQNTIKILEVGAGTGGTSRLVLEALKQNQIQYLYTDISAGFTRYGKDKFGATYPFTEFKVLDIEKPINTQGYTPGSIDIILGSNVLHATRCITNTLNQCKRLLKSNGLLIINELTRQWEFATLTFGLTDGWWLYEDEEVRLEHSPLLGLQKWEEILTANGFKNIRILGIPNQEVEKMEQAVILSESDGWTIDSISNPIPNPITNKAKNQPVVPIISVPHKTKTLPKRNLHEKTLEYIKAVFSNVLKIDNARLETRTTFENYGVDSLVTLDINKEFSKIFKKLPTTLLFEYTTMEGLAEYFIENHPNELEAALGIQTSVQNDDAINAVVEEQEHSLQHTEDLFKSKPFGYFNIPTKKPPLIQTEKINTPDDIEEQKDTAIIGVMGRYPQATNLEEFWKNLELGHDCITEIPPERWNYEENMNMPEEPKWGGFLSDVDMFDPLFFNIAPAEATEMDPQERLFLEIVWELLEDAGITRKKLEEMQNRGEKVGVFVGVMNRDYEWCGGYSSYSSIANRVSYFFNLQGPSLAVDTSCSSSLTAIHLAAQSIKKNECTMAIAGGVNLILHPAHYDAMIDKNMLAKEGRCRSFGKDADGFIVGEGVGAVLLKSMDNARKSGDHIYATIKATVVNSGGKTNGYMVPNPKAQSRLVTEALEESGIHPRTISYIEAQATGSNLADAIEITGLTKSFTQYTNDKQFCSLGSVKSNIGHLESASGIAGITKVLLQFKHKQLVPSIHSDELNPDIHFEDTPFYVQHRLEEWKIQKSEENGQSTQFPRRAGVSSFGAGGANAHVILEEYTNHDQTLPLNMHQDRPFFILLSAKNEKQLKNYAQKMLIFLKNQQKENILDKDPLWFQRLTYTLHEGRESMKHRLALVVSGLDDLITKLTQYTTVPVGTKIDSLYQGQTIVQNNTSVEPPVMSTSPKELAQKWVTGVEILWEQLYPNNNPGFISLPTYPFDRKRYWISEMEITQSSPPPSNTKAKAVREQKTDDKYIKNTIMGILAEVLVIPAEEFDIDAPFTDFGVDSIFAVAIINRLNQQLGLQLRTTDLFNYTSINRLTHHINNETGINKKSTQSEIIHSPGKEKHPTMQQEQRNQLPEETYNRILEIFQKLNRGDITTEDANYQLEINQ